MDTCPFNELHDARHEHVVSVAYRIDLDLLALNILVHEHRLILINLDCCLEIMAKLLFVRDYLHRPAS